MANLPRNVAFSAALDYLYKEGIVADQKELSKITGIAESTISRILNDRVKKPSEDTIRILNQTFDYIFNPAFFRGESKQMLIDENEQTAEPIPMYQAIPVWANTFIEIMTEQVKQNEALNRQLHQSITEVSALKTELQHIIKQLKNKDKKP